MDTLTAEDRSRRMSLIKGKDTKPEITVRKLVFKLGYRFRLHMASLPGKPDLTFFSRRKVIFVHGCFWHRHTCSLGRIPKSRKDFWEDKLEKNRVRDEDNTFRLTRSGWKVLVLWECELKDPNLGSKIKTFLDDE